jgi:hypothetical protein
MTGPPRSAGGGVGEHAPKRGRTGRAADEGRASLYSGIGIQYDENKDFAPM